MLSSFTHVVSISLFLIVEYSIIQSSVDEHLGCLHILATVDYAPVNTGMQICVCVPAFSCSAPARCSFQLSLPAFSSFGYIPRNGISSSFGMVILCLNF